MLPRDQSPTSDADDLSDDGSLTPDPDNGRHLESTLEKLGFGPYQWRLFALCGCGWMSDNSALQCIAVILPRVQVHYGLSSRTSGVLSASTMAGMMIGAVGWGVISDLLGRALPFHATLLLTGVFGILASFAPSFWLLCVCMFGMGTAVGGSMPTDGTLFLENLPHSKQYLLTLLSVFFSFGAVLSAGVAYFLLPGSSCRTFEGCDIAGGANNGWRNVLLVLGCINLACALARSVLFRLYESPRFLVSNGRPKEAVLVLRKIAAFNEHDEFDIDHEDVRQAAPDTVVPLSDASRVEEGRALLPPSEDPIPPLSSTSPTSPTTPTASRPSFVSQASRSSVTPTNRRGGRGKSSTSWLGEWSKKMAQLFSPKWRRTVILMWLIWGSMSFAFTMFNVWLPSVLESRQPEGESAIQGALNEYVLYAVAGCPGSIIGAWMIETRLGRRKSLALCTLATAVAVFAFISVRAPVAATISSMLISLTGTAMYAVLYGMTPETFGTSIRGTACGTSAALSRLAGVIAPIIAGVLLAVQPTLPLITTAAVYVLTAFLAMALPKSSDIHGGSSGAVMH